MGLLADFFKGIFYAVSSVRYLFLDGLKRYIILPLLFNFGIFLTVAYLLYRFYFSYSAYYTAQLPAWLHFLQGAIWIILALSFFLLFLSMFTILFNLIAAPFNGLLAEKAQQLIFNTSIPALSFSEIAIRTIKRQMQFLTYFVPRFIAMILLFFMPFIHPIYPLLWFMFNAWILSMQYQDFVMDNNLIGFDEMKHLMAESKMVSLGFGSVINLASFIPVLNLIIMPSAVIGGTVLYCEQKKAEAGV